MNTTTAEEMRAEVARLRALIEQHEERARVHAEERAAHYAEMARVTGECETLRRTLALSQESLAAASSGRRVTVVDEIARLQRELAAARDEVVRVRALLPAENAVPCPACGVVTMAELDDDGAYVMRRHSRRTTRLGDDEFAWCDGGVVSMEPMTPSALDAAVAAEDRAAVDEPLLDGTDGAHPAWWRGHDYAAEMLTAQRDAAVADAARARAAYAQDLAGLRAEVRRADDERAAWRGLRDAAREMLDALDAPAPVWDADESEHDEHAARLTRALDAVRAMLAGGAL